MVGAHLFEIPAEWLCQGNFDRDMAREVLHIGGCKFGIAWKIVPLFTAVAIQVVRLLPPQFLAIGWSGFQHRLPQYMRG